MRVDRTPDERRHLQVRQILDPVHPDSGALVEIDVVGVHAADYVEQGDRAAVAFVVYSLSQKDRVCDLQPGLLAYFAAHGVLDGLAVLDRSAKPGPAVRVGDLWLVIAMVEEQTAILGHNQQHRRAPQRPRVCIR
jgi:hypothetical protein